MRFLPEYCNWLVQSEWQSSLRTVLMYFRAHLTHALKEHNPDGQINSDHVAAAFQALARNVEATLYFQEHMLLFAAQQPCFSAMQADCIELEAGKPLHLCSLWHRAIPPDQPWRDVKATLGSVEAGDWQFWVEWYEQFLDPISNPPNWELLEQVALIKPEVWEAGPEAVSATISAIQRACKTKQTETRTALSRASLFDFVEFNRRLKAVGFPSDLSPFENAEKRESFVNDVSDFRAGLLDWVDYARDEIVGQNLRLPLLQSAEKLVAQLDAIERSEQVSLRRFVMVASDLRRFSMATKYRDMIGDTLAEMLDDRIDEYRDISGKHFGQIFEVLEPLQKLDLGTHSPGDLIAAIKEALVRMEGVSAADMPPLDPETRVLFEELLRELEEWNAELNEATTDAGREVVRQRFSERFAAFSVTYARMVERGVEVSKSTSKIFDEAVKWYKRWDTIEKIIDWWDKLGGPPSGAG